MKVGAARDEAELHERSVNDLGLEEGEEAMMANEFVQFVASQ